MYYTLKIPTIKIKNMSKYPFFDKKGRPSKVEADICKKINTLINSGQIQQSEVDDITADDGYPTNADELETLYSYLSGESPTGQSGSNNSQQEEQSNTDYEQESSNDFNEQEINEESFSEIKGQKNPKAVGFDPFAEPVIERNYTKGFNIPNEQNEESENRDGIQFDENDLQQPDGGESVANDLNGISDANINEDIPEPEWANSGSFDEDGQGENGEGEEDYEDEDDEEDGKLGDGNLDDLSPAQKRKSAEKTADAIMQMYSKFAPMPFKSWASFKDTTIQKMILDGRLDANMQLENGVTVKDYIDSQNEQVEDIFEVSEETQQEIKDPLVDVLLEQEIALTPTQRLMIAVGSHVVQMGFSAYQLSQNNKIALESFEKFHSQMKKPNPQYQQRPQTTSNSQPNPIVEERISGNDKQAVEDLMREINKDDDGIIDPENDPSVEVTVEENED